MFHIYMCGGNGGDLVLRIVWFHKATDLTRVWPSDSATTYYSVISLSLSVLSVWIWPTYFAKYKYLSEGRCQAFNKALLLTVLINHSYSLPSLESPGFH